MVIHLDLILSLIYRWWVEEDRPETERREVWVSRLVTFDWVEMFVSDGWMVKRESIRSESVARCSSIVECLSTFIIDADLSIVWIDLFDIVGRSTRPTSQTHDSSRGRCKSLERRRRSISLRSPSLDNSQSWSSEDQCWTFVEISSCVRLSPTWRTMGHRSVRDVLRRRRWSSLDFSSRFHSIRPMPSFRNVPFGSLRVKDFMFSENRWRLSNRSVFLSLSPFLFSSSVERLVEHVHRGEILSHHSSVSSLASSSLLEGFNEQQQHSTSLSIDCLSRHSFHLFVDRINRIVVDRRPADHVDRDRDLCLSSCRRFLDRFHSSA